MANIPKLPKNEFRKSEKVLFVFEKWRMARIAYDSYDVPYLKERWEIESRNFLWKTIDIMMQVKVSEEIG